jgi:16S rRNA processing protein RimM
VPKRQETEWATIGQVVALFGIRGEVKVRLLTDIPDRFEQLQTVYLGNEHRQHTIERVRPYKGEMIILKLTGLDDANAATPLVRQEIMIPTSQLAQIPPDRYYQHDILGLTVLTLDGQVIGPIIDILQTGCNDVYTLKGPDGRQVMIPAIKEVVKRIDLIRHTMYIDPLPGLLEPPTHEDEEPAGDDVPGESDEEESLARENWVLDTGNRE